MIKQIGIECIMNDSVASKSKIRLSEPKENQLMINTPMGTMYVGKRDLINALMALEQPIECEHGKEAKQID